jgi:uncharacterized protein YndB with AHSA1/START domain
MSNDLVAKSTITIQAGSQQVWTALTDPARIKKYMFGADVESNWTVGSPIVWRGNYQGKSFEDKGEITQLSPGERLGYTHYSPMSGKPDKPENYHHVNISLEDRGGTTCVVLSQVGNATEKESEHSQKNWTNFLQGLKQTVEGDA